jgi:membrane protein DedA with SNARE-associated domain
VHGLTDFFLNLIHQAGYAGLFVAMTLANIGAPVGSEIVLPAAGVAAQKGALSNVWLVIAVAVLAELCGQSIGYAVGRFGGRPFIDRYGKYVRFHHAELD